MNAMYYSSDSDNGTDKKSFDLSFLMLDSETLSHYLRNNIIEEKSVEFTDDASQQKFEESSTIEESKDTSTQSSSGIYSQASAYPDDQSTVQNVNLSEINKDNDNITEKLFLSHNQIITLPFEILLYQKLKFLDLSNNNIEHVNDFILHLPNLQTLYLKNNQISDDSFPKDLSALTKLKEINLSGNQLSIVPSQLFQLTNLCFLYLGNNSISQVHPEIKDLSNLQILNLGGNQLTSVPHELGDLSKLAALILCNNQLRSLTRSISRLTRLKSLLLHGNNLCCLPVEIVKLRGLNELSLRDNPLVSRFVNFCAKDLMYNPPSLKELAARTIQERKVPHSEGAIPRTLVGYLTSGHKCVNPKCKGMYFTSCVEHIKFVDFCGMYRVPLLHYLCSSRCTSQTPSYYRRNQSSNSNSDSDEEVGMRRVLLG